MNQEFTRRDFLGYGDCPPRVAWPGGARLAVSFVLNVEEGAELSLTAGDERNEAAHEVTHEVKGAPDLCMESHFEYGTRVGYRRIISVIDEAGVPITLNACARSPSKACRGWRAMACHARRDAIARHWLENCPVAR